MWNTRFENSNFGLQGDIQHRNWDIDSDLEQLLIRGGLTWTPDDSNITYTLGYAHIASGAFGRSDGKTPYKLAMRGEQNDVVALLKSKGGR